MTANNNNTSGLFYVSTTEGTTWMGPVQDMRPDYQYHNLFKGTEHDCQTLTQLRQECDGMLPHEEALLDLIRHQERDGSTVWFDLIEPGFIDGTITSPDNTQDDFYMQVSSDGTWSIGWGNGRGKTWRNEQDPQEPCYE